MIPVAPSSSCFLSSLSRSVVRPVGIRTNAHTRVPKASVSSHGQRSTDKKLENAIGVIEHGTFAGAAIYAHQSSNKYANRASIGGVAYIDVELPDFILEDSSPGSCLVTP